MIRLIRYIHRVYFEIARHHEHKASWWASYEEYMDKEGK